MGPGAPTALLRRPEWLLAKRRYELQNVVWSAAGGGSRQEPELESGGMNDPYLTRQLKTQHTEFGEPGQQRRRTLETMLS